MNTPKDIGCTASPIETTPINAALGDLKDSISRCHSFLNAHENKLDQFLCNAPESPPTKDSGELTRSPLHARLIELRRLTDGLAERIAQITDRVVA